MSPSLQNNPTFVLLVMFPLGIIAIAWIVSFFFGVILPSLKLKSFTPLAPIIYAISDSSKARLVKAIQEETKASYGICKQALEELDYDFDKAIQLLRVTDSIVKSTDLPYGRVYTYLHEDTVGVLLEVACQTEEASLSVNMDLFLHEVAVQIALTNPSFIKRNLPKDKTDPLAPLPLATFEDSKLILLEQVSANPYYKGKNIQQVLNELSFYLQEPVIIRRFTRYDLND